MKPATIFTSSVLSHRNTLEFICPAVLSHRNTLGFICPALKAYFAVDASVFSRKPARVPTSCVLSQRNTLEFSSAALFQTAIS